MDIRLMNKEDLDEVAAIEEAIFSQPWSKRGFLDSLENADTLYLVAEQEHEIIGYLGLWQSQEEADIVNVAVKESARRQGAAGRLLEEAVRRAKERGVTALTLEVRVSNAAAIRLYEKHGFRSVGVRPGFYDMPKEDALIMWAGKEFPL